jgi:hypothetical protein
MNSQRGARIISMLFLLDLFIITWSELKPGNNNPSPIGWPRPARYVGLGVAFALLGAFGELANAELAAVVAAGLSMALIIRTVQSGSTSTASGGQVSPPTGPITGTLQV